MSEPQELQVEIRTVADLMRELAKLPADYRIGAGWDSCVSVIESILVHHDEKVIELYSPSHGSLDL